ncbi:hypothetical protein, partial [Ancylobacter sp. G4_0304]|uniref:hypothetical protein n=1 Tax=Ancylobacter sp. G4_0304 TaxID=3114289 RepID=UPI0039C62052
EAMLRAEIAGALPDHLPPEHIQVVERLPRDAGGADASGAVITKGGGARGRARALRSGAAGWSGVPAKGSSPRTAP